MKKSLKVLLASLSILAMSTSFAAAAPADAVASLANEQPGYTALATDKTPGVCDGTGHGRHQGHGRYRNADGTCNNANCPNYKANK